MYPEHIFEFAYISNFEDRLDKLSDSRYLAQQENWEYRYTKHKPKKAILRNYILYTYKRLFEQDKIIKNSKQACFNTGLVTKSWEDIFALFVPNQNQTQQKWYLDGFYKESDFKLKEFNPLPQRASYFDDPTKLIYDTRLDLRIDYNHIMTHNKERFPQSFQSVNDHQLQISLEGAVKLAKKRVERNYKTAVPQYFTDKNAREGKLQLLLPLCLTEPSIADVALAIDIVTPEDGKRYYSAETVLTLDMAYNNARLLCKPDTEWLEP
jgi:hypothetical protein